MILGEMKTKRERERDCLSYFFLLVFSLFVLMYNVTDLDLDTLFKVIPVIKVTFTSIIGFIRV
uniref:Uncharacterized protein n=1 Tax=Tetranychus urticae TaxID=32264 RepID=T1K4X5_TETUR